MKIGTIIIIGIAIFLTGCSTIYQQLDASKFYERDMDIKVNNIEGRGSLVINEADSYKIEGEITGDIDVLVIQSCHREYKVENIDNVFEYTYSPIKDLENNPNCPLHLSAYNKSGVHAWSFIDFSRDSKLPANLKCNGKDLKYGSVSVCQSRSGLIQEINFDTKVKYATTDECNKVILKEDKKIQYEMPRGECIWMFKDENNNIHRMTTLGYEGILIREGY